MIDRKQHRILAIGPLPPPLAGTSVSFITFCEEVQEYSDSIQLDVINSAPKHLGQHRLFTLSHFSTASRILWQLLRRVWTTDRVIVFGSNQFLNSVAPFARFVTTIARKPLFIRAFGGSLDQYDRNLSGVRRWFLRRSIKASDGLIVQTKLMYRYFNRLFPGKISILPGYRKLANAAEFQVRDRPTGEPLRLVFLGHVREEKGVFVLLKCLRSLEANFPKSIQCDVYGPIYANDEKRFQEELDRTDNATWKGVLDRDTVIQTLAEYDAIVFPTFYQGEGHPGVMVEALIAGLPIITTNHRSIPEIVEHEKNGLLVEPENSQELSRAIQRILEDQKLLSAFRDANLKTRNRFDATDKTRLLLEIIGVHVGEVACMRAPKTLVTKCQHG